MRSPFHGDRDSKDTHYSPITALQDRMRKRNVSASSRLSRDIDDHGDSQAQLDVPVAVDEMALGSAEDRFLIESASLAARPEFKNAVARCHRGDKRFRQREYDKAEEDYAASLGVLRILSATREIGWVTLRIGRTASRLRDNARAAKLAEDAMSVFQSIGDAKGLAAAHRLLGHMAYRDRDYSEARKQFRGSLRYLQGLGRDGETGLVMNLVGKTAYRQGDFGVAVESFVKAIALFEGTKDQPGQLQALENLARAHFADGNIAEAHSAMVRRINLCRRMREESELAWSCVGAARLSAEMGAELDYSKYLLEAEELFRNQGDAEGIQGCMDVRLAATSMHTSPDIRML